MAYKYQDEVDFLDELIQLTNAMDTIQEMLRTCRDKNYPIPEPALPVKREVKEPKYPEPDIPLVDMSDKKKLGRSLIMTFAIPTAGIGYLVDRSTRKAEAKKSPEYLARIAPIKTKYEEDCAEAEREYQTALKERASAMIKWSNDKAEWETKRLEDEATHAASLKAVRAERKAFLDEHKLISDDYLLIEHLINIRDYMTQTDCSIKDAVEWLDRQHLIAAENRRAAEERRANAIYEQHLAAERNREFELQERQVAAMEEANRIASRQGFVDAIQTHNRNKYLKKLSDR